MARVGSSIVRVWRAVTGRVASSVTLVPALRSHTTPVTNFHVLRLEHGAIGIVCGKLRVEKGDDGLKECSAPAKTVFC